MGKLKVYYGWAKITGIRKRIAISVMYENDIQGCRSERGQRCLKTIQETVFERYQTKIEHIIKTASMLVLVMIEWLWLAINVN